MSLKLTSLQNPQIKMAVKLQQRSFREDTGLFLIEGYRELKRAVEAGVCIQKVFFCKKLFLGSNEFDLLNAAEQSGSALIECTDFVFEKLSYRDRPDGLLAVAVQMKTPLAALKAKTSSAPFIVVAEGIEKPGNLGSILRSADGAGVDGVIVCDRCTDVYNPNVVRSSIGTLFTLPVIEEEGAKAFLWLKEHQIKVVAASPHAAATFTETDLQGPIAIVVGTEQLGLSEMWLKAADVSVRIPMQGKADSLNVGAATTLLLYEVLRQRKQGVTLGRYLL